MFLIFLTFLVEELVRGQLELKVTDQILNAVRDGVGSIGAGINLSPDLV